jgi:uridine phosphorylase
MFLPILQVDSRDLPSRAIVCGDPKRAEYIASKLANQKELSFSREYRTFTGEYEGVILAVVSHGVGSPGAAVCFEELIRAGVTSLIRVGTAGSYSADVPPGGLVISTAAVREEGLTRQLVPIGFPAVADSELVQEMHAVALSMNGKVTKGITLTLDAFFMGVEEFPHKKYQKAGVIAVEMEISSLYIIASLRGVKAAAIVAIDGYADDDLGEVYNPNTETVVRAVDQEIDIALRTIIRF